MKRLFLGLLLVGISAAARAQVGPGVASELSVTSPLLQGGQAAPALSVPAPHLAPSPVAAPEPVHPAPAPANVVAPLPGASAQAPVAVSVGPTVPAEHGLRGWFHRHLWGHRH